MTPEDILKVKSKILKSGFPFELEIARIFRNKNWRIESNSYYIDKDEKKGREIDLIADYTRQFRNANRRYVELTFSLIIEVKKETEKPWVIFSTETTHFEKLIYELYGDKVYNNFKNADLSKSFRKNNQKLNDRLGRSFAEGFSQGRDKIFSSLCNVTKAFLSKKETTRKDESSDSILYYFEPLIVLNGELLEAYLDKTGELQVIQKSHLQVRFNYMSDNYPSRTNGYIINIITKDFLEEYLKTRVSQFDKISEENKNGI